MSDPQAQGHAALMDSVYRGQRHIYDLTRKYYLFGRDRLIAALDCGPGDAVLEIACGTGRNLAKIGKAYPGVELYGIDISSEMLKSARTTLGDNATLAPGDARDFDAEALLGRGRFDRVVLSYSLSMIPDWERALAHAATLVAPGGSLHVVDFGTLETMPGPLAALLRGWLAKFHVEPRASLLPEAGRLADSEGLRLRSERGRLSYFTRLDLGRPR
ncbi:class I SAM-dependent methyltransferase [Qipengyuania sp. JC766]|uniref:class I SAM-dependent methyltransferase n=1 Tax=Qipengyuania sp. JC766 TaxID=3232139 RepID=UPI00345ADEEE